MQQFKLQAILNEAQQSENFNILAKNKTITIRRSTSGELAKLYSENNIASLLLPNPAPTDIYGQFSFYAQDGKYKIYNSENVELAEFTLQDPFMTVIEVGAIPFTVTGQNHNNCFMINSEENITITVGKPIMDSPLDYQTGILMFFTQIGEGVIFLEPEIAIPPETQINLIVPENSSPQTYGIGSTIGILSRNNHTWVVTGNLGY